MKSSCIKKRFNTPIVSVEYYLAHLFHLQIPLGFNTPIVSVEWFYKDLEDAKYYPFQYSNCIGGIFRAQYIIAVLKGVSILQLYRWNSTCEARSPTYNLVSILQLYRWNEILTDIWMRYGSFNTSTVSVELAIVQFNIAIMFTFQYFNCIGGILLNLLV